jgi:hypothetical protein
LGLENPAQGFERFYNIAITPACRLTLDLQVVEAVQARLQTATVVGFARQRRFLKAPPVEAVALVFVLVPRGSSSASIYKQKQAKQSEGFILAFFVAFCSDPTHQVHRSSYRFSFRGQGRRPN